MFKPNHALTELEMRYAISSSVKARSRSTASAFKRLSAPNCLFALRFSSEKAGRRAQNKKPLQDA
ncbi:hypothetical protein HMPREF1586_01041 [Gardnerella vaginalis JCP8522]|nr:hypothetical protein HMPREF1586_01041 [Gardnerella vaginalis JCP8522]